MSLLQTQRRQALVHLGMSALLIIPGCASPTSTGPGPRSSSALHASLAREAAPSAATMAPKLAPNEISRASYDRTLARGAHHFIQFVTVRPTFHERQFFGWRIVAYDGPGPIRRGDVVTRVNGNKLERPEQVIPFWQSLPGRGDLSIQLVRNGAPRVFSYRIVDP